MTSNMSDFQVDLVYAYTKINMYKNIWLQKSCVARTINKTKKGQ